MTLNKPTAIDVNPATFADTLAASASVAPIRFAIRVDAAMEIGKGIWNVNVVIVARTDCAARCAVPK